MFITYKDTLISLPSFTIMTSVIPDGKTIRKQLSDAELAAYINHGHRLYRYSDSRTKAHSAPRLETSQM